MSAAVSIGIAIVLSAFGLGLVGWATHRAGRLAERAKVEREDAEATRAASEVMVEKRTPADARKRLRDGTF